MIPSCQSNPFLSSQLIAQLHALGVQPGGVLLVHCAFEGQTGGGRPCRIDRRPPGCRPRGTPVMPSMSWDDEHPLIRGRPPASKKWAWSPIPSGGSRASCAATARIPCRRWPQAARITAPHPVEIPHGIDSPVGRVYELDGQLLPASATHPTPPSTWPSCWRGRYRRPKSVLVRQGEQIARVDYGENDHRCQNLPSWLAGWTRRVSSAAAWWVMPGRALVRSRDIVETVVERLRAEETISSIPMA